MVQGAGGPGHQGGTIALVLPKTQSWGGVGATRAKGQATPPKVIAPARHFLPHHPCTPPGLARVAGGMGKVLHCLAGTKVNALPNDNSIAAGWHWHWHWHTGTLVQLFAAHLPGVVCGVGGDQNAAPKAAKQWLQANSGWPLVVGGASWLATALWGCIPPIGTGGVLATSQGTPHLPTTTGQRAPTVAHPTLVSPFGGAASSIELLQAMGLPNKGQPGSSPVGGGVLAGECLGTAGAATWPHQQAQRGAKSAGGGYTECRWHPPSTSSLVAHSLQTPSTAALGAPHCRWRYVATCLEPAPLWGQLPA